MRDKQKDKKRNKNQFLEMPQAKAWHLKID